MDPYPSADTDTCRIPPGSTHAAERLRTALWPRACAVPWSAVTATKMARASRMITLLPNAIPNTPGKTVYPAK